MYDFSNLSPRSCPCCGEMMNDFRKVVKHGCGTVYHRACAEKFTYCDGCHKPFKKQVCLASPKSTTRPRFPTSPRSVSFPDNLIAELRAADNADASDGDRCRQIITVLGSNPEWQVHYGQVSQLFDLLKGV